MKSLSETPRSNWIVWCITGIIFIGLLVLTARLFELQVIKGEYFKVLAEENRVRKVSITAPRGDILARGGEVLVDNEEVKKILEFNPESGFIKKDGIPTNDQDSITEWKRKYRLGSKFAHVSGYLGQVSQEELGKIDPKCPEKGPKTVSSWVGRGGLEQEYSCLLRGIDGEELIEVDTFGKKVRTLGTKTPLKGEDIKTSIDFGLQEKVAEIFEKTQKQSDEYMDKSGKRKGAVVVSDGWGQILAFYSSPSFDPNIFLTTSPDNAQKIQTVFSDESLPAFNRVIGGGFHPGSVFKIVTSIAALQEGKITKEFQYDDPGVININQFSYANWLFTQYGRKEGNVNVEKALARSTDTYYYKVGEFLGAENLAKWARIFGYGKITGIDIPGEVAGLVPDPEWKKKTKGENWFLGNTYHYAIGQGDLTATPLEVNMMTSIIANGGYLCRPFINPDGKSKDKNCTKLDIKSEHIQTVRNGMVSACSEGGTAYPFFEFSPKVACKTGTAETEEEDKTHAWFTIYGPIEEKDSTMPQIVVTMLVEKAGEGSKVAAPLAKEIFKYWFYDRNP